MMAPGARGPAASLDRFLRDLAGCLSMSRLFDVLRLDMEREGLRDIVFTRLGPPDEDVLDGLIPQNLSRGRTSRSINEEYLGSDPLLYGLISRFRLEPSTNEAAPVAGQFDLSISFHGPGGRCDIFNFFQSNEAASGRLPVIRAKTYAAWLRFMDLERVEGARRPGTIYPIPEIDVSALAAGAEAHVEQASHITEEECRALVFADIGLRRYRAGLVELSDGLTRQLGSAVFESLISKGLVREEADDLRFHFVFRLTPLGRAHIKSCPAVRRWRQEVWSSFVDAGERPVA